VAVVVGVVVAVAVAAVVTMTGKAWLLEAQGPHASSSTSLVPTSLGGEAQVEQVGSTTPMPMPMPMPMLILTNGQRGRFAVVELAEL
jgi:ABC-type phosphate transport system substrate-binding protein